MLQSATRQRNVRAVSVSDPQGLVLARFGGDAENHAAMARLTEEAIAARGIVSSRARDGVIAVAAPVIRDGQLIGVAVRMWEADAYRFDAIPVACAVHADRRLLGARRDPANGARRSAAPSRLSMNSRATRKKSARKVRPRRSLCRTGDEFETLANAFNNMTGRLDASMRQIQEIAFVDPVTRLPNQDRFIREVDYFILQNQTGQSDGGGRGDGAHAPAAPDANAGSRCRARVSCAWLRTVSSRRCARLIASCACARRASVRPPARLSVSEFGVLAPDLASPPDAARFAQHLNAALDQPFEWRGHKLTLGACCGVALAPRDGRDADAAIRHARMAMAAAHTAPARVKVYTQSLDREAVARLTLEREMRGALERNEFRAYFQPKINLKTGRIEACEALARWIRPDRTIISPGRFIPVAEESGLIGALSDAIMREACWKAAAWARAGPADKGRGQRFRAAIPQ
jgi:predicted signal transduction protein with EAL and GGDEF domain